MSAAEAQALAERVAQGMFSRDTAAHTLGVHLVRVAPGHAEVAMMVRADMLNGHAICHGGFIFTLADTAFAYACNSYNLNTVASGCAIDFLAPAREGDVLIAVGQERSASGRTNTSRSSEVIAATATWAIVDPPRAASIAAAKAPPASMSRTRSSDRSSAPMRISAAITHQSADTT